MLISHNVASMIARVSMVVRVSMGGGGVCYHGGGGTWVGGGAWREVPHPMQFAWYLLLW